MNAVAFYVLAAIIVAGSAGSVVLPRARDAAAALAATLLVAGLLIAVAGGIAVGILEFVIPVAAGAGLWLALRRGNHLGLLGEEPLPSRSWWLAAAAAAALGLLALVVVIASGGAWHSGSSNTALISVLHYWAPYALVIAAALAVTAVATALVLGRTSADERAVDRAAEERRHREELARRRREDREAARRRRAPAGEGTR